MHDRVVSCTVDARLTFINNVWLLTIIHTCYYIQSDETRCRRYYGVHTGPTGILRLDVYVFKAVCRALGTYCIGEVDASRPIGSPTATLARPDEHTVNGTSTPIRMLSDTSRSSGTGDEVRKSRFVHAHGADTLLT